MDATSPPPTHEATRARDRARVLIVDDLQDLRDLLRLQLRARSSVEVVGEAADGVEAIEQCVALQPDLVFLDVNMPHLSGIDALPQMLQGSPRTRIVMLSSHVDDHTKQLALRHGAHHYIDKADGRSAVLAAVDEVLGRAC